MNDTFASEPAHIQLYVLAGMLRLDATLTQHDTPHDAARRLREYADLLDQVRTKLEQDTSR